ncbi:MAG: 4-hydroxythreonine-4-phosphate dehydrogenase PdxA [Anaerolineae bacterium]|nr:4-hydroxythreonine-4-phosphate dehydrogenase PdxA [Gloeobacterales cyanobacterium ES-bin-313]
MNPKLAITLGDPAGIGPEVVLKALAQPRPYQPVIFGTREILEETWISLRRLGVQDLADPAALDIRDISGGKILQGVATAESGALSFAYLQAAIAATLSGECQAIITAPIAKNAWHKAGHFYPGQTEVLTELSGAKRSGMLFVAHSPQTNFVLRVLLATTHIPLSQVPKVVNAERIVDRLALLRHSLSADFGIRTPRIAVAGLNPHSGEEGQIGTEESDWLTALLVEQQVSGPLAPDTMWLPAARAWQDPESPIACDAYLALYHDQGLIPVKMLAFDQAVNTTIGLPIVRTSPDHGTAFDIAGRGIARSASMVAAIDLAISLASYRNLSPKI